MKFGVCCAPDLVPAAKAAGFEYQEWSVAGLLRPAEGEAVFRAALAIVRTAGLPCPVLNCFVPGTLKITGPDAQPDKLKAYVATVLRRAEDGGVTMIVFGSGGARRIPEGFPRQAAWAQLAEFCRMVGPIARQHGVTVVVEPLNRAECNVLTTVREAAELVRLVDHPAVRLLVDAYHLLKDGDALADVIANAGLLAHVHLATIPNRLAPAAEACDFAPFFQALKQGGYDGAISVETASQNGLEAALPEALAFLKKLDRA